MATFTAANVKAETDSAGCGDVNTHTGTKQTGTVEDNASSGSEKDFFFIRL